jgi:hypothetical protein
MKKLLFLFLLIPALSEAQVNSKFIYQMLEKDSISTSVIRAEAEKVGNEALHDLGISGDFQYPESDYDLSIYSGETIDVISLIDCDKEYFKDAKHIYVFTAWSFMTDCSIVLIYKL